MSKLLNVAKNIDYDDIRIRNIILNTAQEKDQIIYGARAINTQVPTYLRRKTKDYDILTKKPKKSAEEIAKRLRNLLDKKVTVEKALHKGTYKVKVNGKSIVDYTQLKRKPKTVNILSNKYYSVKSIRRNLQRSTKKSSNEYRLKKDLGSIDRIKELEKAFNI